MWTCGVCHTAVVYDDVALQTVRHGHCICCLRCYHRLAETAAAMGKELRRALVETLAGISSGGSV